MKRAILIALLFPSAASLSVVRKSKVVVDVDDKGEQHIQQQSHPFSSSMSTGSDKSKLASTTMTSTRYAPMQVPDGFGSCDDNVFTVMSWNVYLMDKRAGLIKQDGQDYRPPHIASYIGNLTQAMCIDVVVLQEAWQHYDHLIDMLKPVLPYNTAGWMKKASRHRLLYESGGVFMLSRHPFEYASHWFPYSDSASEGKLVYKGYGVIRVQKGNRHHWVVGTHTQSFKDKIATRTAQMEEMKKTIGDEFTNSQERGGDPWYFAGDFNMNYQDPHQGKGEVEHFMSLFDLSLPHQVDWKHGNYTWLKDNALNEANYPGTEKSEWLDFVFHNNAKGLKSAKGVTLGTSSGVNFETKIKGKTVISNCLADHQPVVGRFTYHQANSSAYSNDGLDYNQCTGDSDCQSGFCRWSFAKDEEWVHRCRPLHGWGYGRKCWRTKECQAHLYCSPTRKYCRERRLT